MKNYRQMIEDLREEFETLFPKDLEATEGIRPSKSHRGEALVLWAKFVIILREAVKQTAKRMVVEELTHDGLITGNATWNDGWNSARQEQLKQKEEIEKELEKI